MFLIWKLKKGGFRDVYTKQISEQEENHEDKMHEREILGQLSLPSATKIVSLQ